MSQLPYIVAIYSSQGGSGKTAVSVNVAKSLSEMGRRVLVVAVQRDALSYLDVPVIDFSITPSPVDSKQFIQKSQYLSVYSMTCRTSLCFENLWTYLQTHRRRYDSVIIDLNDTNEVVPGVLSRADRIIVPYRLNGSPSHALRSVFKAITRVKQRGNYKLDIDIVATRVNQKSKMTNDLWSLLLESYGPLVSLFRIAETTYESEAIMMKIPFVDCFPGHPNAENYKMLAKGLLSHMPPTKSRSLIRR